MLERVPRMMRFVADDQLPVYLTLLRGQGKPSKGFSPWFSRQPVAAEVIRMHTTRAQIDCSLYRFGGIHVALAEKPLRSIGTYWQQGRINLVMTPNH